MTTTLADPRTEQVLRAADDVHHDWCDLCWAPGVPAVCGEPALDGVDACPEDCGCPPCSMCELEWDAHERSHRPWWKRWLS